MLPIIFEVPVGKLPRDVLRETWELLNSTYLGECGRATVEPPVPPGVYRATLEIPLRVQAYILCLDALTAMNVWARERQSYPSVYDGHLRYVAEPPGWEVWASTPALYARGVGDCEDIATDRAAELQLRGIPARAVLRLESRNADASFWHVMVQHPNGSIEDPCIALGMKT